MKRTFLAIATLLCLAQLSSVVAGLPNNILIYKSTTKANNPVDGGGQSRAFLLNQYLILDRGTLEVSSVLYFSVSGTKVALKDPIESPIYSPSIQPAAGKSLTCIVTTGSMDGSRTLRTLEGKNVPLQVANNVTASAPMTLKERFLSLTLTNGTATKSTFNTTLTFDANLTKQANTAHEDIKTSGSRVFDLLVSKGYPRPF